MSATSKLFSSGAEWVRVDFHLHTKADKEFQYSGDEDEFRQRFVGNLKNQGISLGVITNHNKFAADEFRSLQTYGTSEGVCLLPGVELSVADGSKGVHTLIVFSDEWVAKNHDYINPFLTSAFEGKLANDYENKNGRTTTSLTETIKKLDGYNKDYFLVFAHVEDGSGLWKEMSGGRISELGNNEGFRQRTLGFQKVLTHDGAGKDVPCRTKVQEWLGGWYPAEVEGSDPKNLDQIGKGKVCYAKLGELSFASLKFALRDHQQRIASEEEPNPTTPRLKEIQFTGGKLADETFAFSNQLTCMIGSRGSGKSSVLECLRYGLGIEAGEADARYKDGLIAYMMGNGARLSIFGSLGDGRDFEITRALNLPPTVFVDGDEVQIKPINLLSGLLYFGQKDLGNRQDGFEDTLFEKLVGRRSVENKTKEEKLIQEVKVAAETYRAVRNADLKVKEYEEEEEELKLRLDVFKKKGVEKQLIKQTDFDTDKRNLQEFINQLAEFQDYMAGDPEEWESVQSSWPAMKSESLSSENKALAALLPELSKIKNNFDAVLNALSNLIEKAREQLSSVLAKEKALQDEFLQLQREIDAPGLNLQEFRNLKSRHEKLTKLIAAAKNQKTSSGNALQSVKADARQLHELRSSWHREEFKIVEVTNKKLPESLKLTLTHEGNREEFSRFLQQLASGLGFRRTSFEKIIGRYPNGLSLVEGVADLDELLGGSADVQKLKSLMRENLEQIVTFQTPDARSILFDGMAIEGLSLGQRATALLQLLMSLEDHPIFIIDQPEDDLDNETIFREVVEPLLFRKKRSQFIIATHNPNIPVLGDADLVHACRENDQGHYIHESGSLDAKRTREKIVSIMEGGAQAFEKRRKIYNQWTNLPSEKNS